MTTTKQLEESIIQLLEAEVAKIWQRGEEMHKELTGRKLRRSPY